MIRRLATAVLVASMAVAGLVATTPATAAQCAANDPYDHMHYTFYWYECRRNETPNPDLLPRADPETGDVTMCIDNGQNSLVGPPPLAPIPPIPIVPWGKDGKTCFLVRAGQGLPSQVCTPPTSPVSACQQIPALFNSDDPDPEHFDYDSFQVCDPSGSICRSSFPWQCPSVKDDGGQTETLACVGAGLKFKDPRNPAFGVDMACVGVSTPVDAPGTWTLVCVNGPYAPLIRQK